MIDPRFSAVKKRLEQVDRVVAVTGGKGGIGKSMIASTLALTLAESGRIVGLLDLDLTAPTDHVILGIDDRFPTEEFGIEPPTFAGIRFMSVTYFAKERPVPLRGGDVTNALLELMAITRWGKLDALVIDMPPGLGDATLDAVRLIPRAEYLIVANSSKVVRETVRRNLQLLSNLKVSIAGVVENMKRRDTPAVRDLAARFDVPFLGEVLFDDALEDAIGDATLLAGTNVAAAVRKLRDALFGPPEAT